MLLRARRTAPVSRFWCAGGACQHTGHRLVVVKQSSELRTVHSRHRTGPGTFPFKDLTPFPVSLPSAPSSQRRPGTPLAWPVSAGPCCGLSRLKVRRVQRTTGDNAQTYTDPPCSRVCAGPPSALATLVPASQMQPSRKRTAEQQSGERRGHCAHPPIQNGKRLATARTALRPTQCTELRPTQMR